jgi:3-keto-disaccharide hydrolase
MNFLVTICASIILFIPTFSNPQPSSKPTPQWTRLFNGRNLDGWKSYGDEQWLVEDGTILGESAAGKYGYLVSDKIYRDFDLRVRFKGEANGNSGLFFHCKITGQSAEGPDIQGVQAEVDPTPGHHTGGLYESGGRGWLIQPTPEGEKALKSGEWNLLEVSAHGSHVVTRLNGKTIADYHDPAPKFTEGAIAFQIHTGGGVKVRWKDIEIRGMPVTN